MKKIRFFFIAAPLLSSIVPFFESKQTTIDNNISYSLNSENVNFSYNNSFARVYDQTLSLGINTTSNGWANFNVGLVENSDGTISINAIQNYTSDYSRRLTNSSQVDKSFYSTYNLDSIGSGFYINKFSKESGSNILNNYYVTSMGGEYNYWWFNQLNDGIENSNILPPSTIIADEYASLSLEENTSISLGLKIYQNNEWVSVLRASTSSSINNALTNRWPNYSNQNLNPQNMTGMSNSLVQNGQTYMQSASLTYSYYDGVIDVYSGDTNLKSTICSISNIDFNNKNMLASDFLSSISIDEIERNLTIQTVNGYPGMKYSVNKMNIYADDKKGSIYLSYSPTTILKNGSIIPNNDTIEVEIVSGFIAMESSSPENGMPFWIWIIIGVSILIILLICILVPIILKKKKDKSKKLDKAKVIPNNQKKLLVNGSNAPINNKQLNPPPIPGQMSSGKQTISSQPTRPGQPVRPGQMNTVQGVRQIPGQPVRPGQPIRPGQAPQPQRPTPPPPITMDKGPRSNAPKMKVK